MKLYKVYHEYFSIKSDGMCKKFVTFFPYILIVIPSYVFCLHINIVCELNGGGMQKDYEILERELQLLGHHVKQVALTNKAPISEADINIFIELPKKACFPFAKKNYFIPNPEWYCADRKMIPQFDLILCRTHEVERIFQQFTKNTYFLGFTSMDKFDDTIAKEYNQFLHVAGTSHQKGTQTILDLWAQRPDFPLLISSGSLFKDPKIHNVLHSKERIPEELFTRRQNECGIHLCTSETEGFGHYLVEAMSTGAVVITTDAPPMNEHIQDRRCLVGYNATKPQRLAINYYVDPVQLECAISDLLALPKEEVVKIGQHNRQLFLEQREAFRKRLRILFP